MSENSEVHAQAVNPIRRDVVATNPRCPDCGCREIFRRRDAWEVRALTGFDEDGDPVLDEDTDIELFDDVHFECDRCGYKGGEASEFDSDFQMQELDEESGGG